MPALLDSAPILTLHEKGFGCKDIAETLGINRGTVSRHLKQLGVKTRRKDYTIDDKAFQTPSEERDYFAGLIATDGCIYKPSPSKSKSISIGLYHTDAPVLEAFLRYVGSNKSVTRCKDMSKVDVRSDEIAETLEAFGITERKSLTLQIVNQQLLQSRHFWRGCLDGDGSVFVVKERRGNKYFPQLKVTFASASRVFVEQFLTFVRTYILPDTKVSITHHDNKFAGIYHVKFSCLSARKVLSYLYGDSTVYLERKYNLAKQHLEGLV